MFIYLFKINIVSHKNIQYEISDPSPRIR